MLRPAMLLVTVVLLAGQSSLAHALARQTDDLGGAYYCDGTDVDGRSYHGTVSIGKHGDVYYLEWRFGSRRAAVGFGIVSGDVLAVSYYGRSSGVVVYRINGATLDGHWTEVGTTGRLFVETLSRVPHPNLEERPKPAEPAGVPI